MNPYRTGLSQFLANEEAKELELKQAEQARELERRADAIKESSPKQGEDHLAASSTTETEGTELLPINNPYSKEEEFKFTIDADDEDEDLQKIEIDESGEKVADKSEQPTKEEEPLQEVVQEQFVDSDEDEEEAAKTETTEGDKSVEAKEEEEDKVETKDDEEGEKESEDKEEGEESKEEIK